MELSEFEVECANCSGTGTIEIKVLPLRGGPKRPCPVCYGTGMVLTPKGKELIGFVHRHLIRAHARGIQDSHSD